MDTILHSKVYIMPVSEGRGFVLVHTVDKGDPVVKMHGTRWTANEDAKSRVGQENVIWTTVSSFFGALATLSSEASSASASDATRTSRGKKG